MEDPNCCFGKKKKKKTLDVHESGNVIPVNYTQQARVYKKQRDSDGRC